MRLQRQLGLLYRAFLDPEAPWYFKCLVVCILAYLVSPLDLIPDFIPVIGLLDELVLVPAGITLALSLLPAHIIARYRETAGMSLPPWMAIAGIALVVLCWMLGLAIALAWLLSA